MTHVDFSALDQLNLKPLGIYGSRSEIVRYLHDQGLISGETYVVGLYGCNETENSIGMSSELI